MGEEKAAGWDLLDFPLHPPRSLLWSGWPTLLHELTAVGHLEWLNCSHYLSPSSGPPDLREFLCLILKCLPIPSTPTICHPCPFQNTHHMGSHEPCSEPSRLQPKEWKPESSIQISVPALFSLPSLFPHVLGLEGVGFPLPLWAYSECCPWGVYSKLLAPRALLLWQQELKEFGEILPCLEIYFFQDFCLTNKDHLLWRVPSFPFLESWLSLEGRRTLKGEGTHFNLLCAKASHCCARQSGF